MIREILSRSFGAVLLIFGLAVLGYGLWAAVSDGRWSYLGACVFGGFVAMVGLGRLFPGQPPPLPIETGEPLMEAAMERARREFTRFERGLAEGKREALVKYAMKTGYCDNEHVWAIAHAIDDGSIITSLASEPVGNVDVKVERKRIPLSEIEDWLLIGEDGRIEGGFTQIAMARIFQRDKGYVPYAIRKGLSDFVDVDYAELV